MVHKSYNYYIMEEIIVIVLSLILLLCSYGPLVWRYLTPPAGKSFLGVFGFPPDFYGNLNAYQEGRAGLWQNLDKTSSTAIGPPVWLKLEYRALGWLSRFLPFEMTISFHLFRFILSVILIIVSYWLISQVFKTKIQRLSAFLLAFFSTAMLSTHNNLILFWTPLSVFQRATYFPHYLFAFIFTLLTIIYLAKALTGNRWQTWALAAVFGFLAGFTHAFTLISLILTLPFYFLFKPKRNWQQLIKLTIFVFLSSLALLYQWQIRHLKPWSLFTNIEMTYNLINNVSLKDFIFGIGPTLILGLIGAVRALRGKNNLLLLLAPWSVVYLAGYFFLWRLFGLNSARFLQTPFYIILGILSVYAIDTIANSRPKMTLFISIFILLLSLPAFRQSFLINHDYFIDHTVYASPNYLAALNWLAGKSKQTDVFLSDQTDAMVVTARAGLMPYLSTYSGTLPTYGLLQTNANSFLNQLWNQKEAADFVNREKIKYVFVRSDHQLSYPFLQLVFTNPEVTIYQARER